MNTLVQWIILMFGVIIAVGCIAVMILDFIMEKKTIDKSYWKMFVDDRFIRFIDSKEIIERLPEFIKYDFVFEDLRNGQGLGVIRFLGINRTETGVNYHSIIIKKGGVK